jgi:hypothetical protein
MVGPEEEDDDDEDDAAPSPASLSPTADSDTAESIGDAVEASSARERSSECLNPLIQNLTRFGQIFQVRWPNVTHNKCAQTNLQVKWRRQRKKNLWVSPMRSMSAILKRRLSEVKSIDALDV